MNHTQGQAKGLNPRTGTPNFTGHDAKKGHRPRKGKPEWVNFQDDIIRIELRGKPPEDEKIIYRCPCGQEKYVEEILNDHYNRGIKVAYFIPLANHSFGDVIKESISIIKLIYRGYFRRKFNKRKYGRNQGDRHNRPRSDKIPPEGRGNGHQGARPETTPKKNDSHHGQVQR